MTKIEFHQKMLFDAEKEIQSKKKKRFIFNLIGIIFIVILINRLLQFSDNISELLARIVYASSGLIIFLSLFLPRKMWHPNETEVHKVFIDNLKSKINHNPKVIEKIDTDAKRFNAEINYAEEILKDEESDNQKLLETKKDKDETTN